MLKRRNCTWIATITATFLVIGLVGCVNQKGTQQDEMANEQMIDSVNYISSKNLADSVKEKYEDDSKYIYGDTIVLEDRGQSFEFEIGFDPKEYEIERWNEICAIYQDPNLQYEIVPNFTHDKENNKIIISPTRYPVGNIQVNQISTEELNGYSFGGGILFPKDEGCDWGNLGTMYFALFRDLQTGEILDKPIVHIVNVKGEIPKSPVINFSVTKDGRALFSWSPVEGAKKYVICKLQFRDNVEGLSSGMYGWATPVAVTEGCSWMGEAPNFNAYIMNNEFRYYEVSEDDWINEDNVEALKERYEEVGKVYYPESVNQKYCVIAINEEGTSMMSNTYSLKEIAANLPSSYAHDTALENNTLAGDRESIEDMPVYQYITMCDGYTAEKLINYKTEEAKVLEERWYILDDEGIPIDIKDVKVLRIPCIVEGTAFESEMYIGEYDEANLEQDLLYLEEREASVRKRAGNLIPSSDYNQGETQECEQIRDITSIPVTANSALSEYLARNMMAGMEVIDLSDFPEAASQKILYDAWAEAYYQNPIILGVQRYGVNGTYTKLQVVYDDVDALPKKQQELLDVIPKIIDTIITEDMTDLEKEFAINEYLCENIEYDEEALENAKANDYKFVDAQFNDSFTAYGALINGKCVCAGYAAAFKLLAEEAGLDSIVVTGLLEGNLNHAWNKVKIGESWQVVDVTNNDMKYLENALLNLSNSVGDKVLIEDKDYVLDDVLSDYVASSDVNEYYRVNNRYFSYEEVVNQLISELKEDGKTLLRTEYELDDEIFYSITDEIYEQMSEDVRLKGFYWMGVIYLEIKK